MNVLWEKVKSRCAYNVCSPGPAFRIESGFDTCICLYSVYIFSLYVVFRLIRKKCQFYISSAEVPSEPKGFLSVKLMQRNPMGSDDAAEGKVPQILTNACHLRPKAERLSQ